MVARGKKNTMSCGNEDGEKREIVEMKYEEWEKRIFFSFLLKRIRQVATDKEVTRNKKSNAGSGEMGGLHIHSTSSSTRGITERILPLPS